MAKVVFYAKTQEDIDELCNSEMDNCIVVTPKFFESIFPEGAEMQGRLICDAKLKLIPFNEPKSKNENK